MTTIALPRAIEQPVEQKGGSRLGWAIQDTLTVTWRNLIALARNQQTVLFSAIQPIMFTLLFVYVFGGAIHTSVPYVDYLIPGIYVQTVTFGAVSTAVGLSEDLHKGLIERFRALPMSRWAVLAGRTTADQGVTLNGGTLNFLANPGVALAPLTTTGRLGTVTVDFDSLEDDAVTVRDRDTTDQVRVPIADLLGELRRRTGEE